MTPPSKMLSTHKHMQTHAHTHKQTNERTNKQTNQTNNQPTNQPNKQTNISKIRCRLLQQTLTVRRWLKDLRNRWMPKTTQSKAQQKQSNPQKKANKQLGTAHREISPCWPTPRPRRSPQSPEQQQARKKTTKKMLQRPKVSNRPQANKIYNASK